MQKKYLVRDTTVENCFADVAKEMFGTANENQTVVITFEFKEQNLQKSLLMWLKLIIQKAKQHQIAFSDFRLKHKGDIWYGTLAGYKLPAKNKQTFTRIKINHVLITKQDHQWQTSFIAKVA